jgi:hypothetical protein
MLLLKIIFSFKLWKINVIITITKFELRLLLMEVVVVIVVVVVVGGGIRKLKKC